jgi:hypothetical protein
MDSELKQKIDLFFSYIILTFLIVALHITASFFAIVWYETDKKPIAYLFFSIIIITISVMYALYFQIIYKINKLPNHVKSHYRKSKRKSD